jgi:hypothetical protein
LKAQPTIEGVDQGVQTIKERVQSIEEEVQGTVEETNAARINVNISNECKRTNKVK